MYHLNHLHLRVPNSLRVGNYGLYLVSRSLSKTGLEGDRRLVDPRLAATIQSQIDYDLLRYYQ